MIMAPITMAVESLTTPAVAITADSSSKWWQREHGTGQTGSPTIRCDLSMPGFSAEIGGGTAGGPPVTAAAAADDGRRA
jgi:hypothetical protein